MTTHRLGLAILDGRLAVCRLGPRDDVPSWAFAGGFASVTRTTEEVSIVCDESAVPEGVRAELGWRALRVAGVLDFALVGVLAALTAPLGGAGIAAFAVSTYDTDYMLVKEPDLGRAVEALTAAGHRVLA